MNIYAGRGLLAARRITRHSPRLRGLAKVIPPIMALSSRLPESLRIRVVEDIDRDLTMELCLDDHVQGYIFWNPSGYEKHTLAVIKRHLKPGDVFLDIGANVGFYSLIGAKLVGAEGIVVAIEPDPENFAQLCRNISLNDLTNIIAINKGISDSRGALALMKDADGNRGAHTFAHNPDSLEWVNVQVDTLDDVIAELGLSTIDLVKIDVEGFEYRVLADSRIFDYRPVIVTEVFEHHLSRAGSSSEVYLQMLRSKKYAVERIPRDDLNFLCTPIGS